MAFDDIPEDREQSFPCNCGGNIKEREDGKWECDSCEWASHKAYECVQPKADRIKEELEQQNEQ